MKKETYFVIFQKYFESELIMLWVCVNFVLWRYEDRIEGRKKVEGGYFCHLIDWVMLLLKAKILL